MKDKGARGKKIKEEEFDMNGMMSNQALVDDLYAQRKPSEGAFPATAMHQTFRDLGSYKGGDLLLVGCKGECNHEECRGQILLGDMGTKVIVAAMERGECR